MFYAFPPKRAYFVCFPSRTACDVGPCIGLNKSKTRVERFVNVGSKAKARARRKRRDEHAVNLESLAGHLSCVRAEVESAAASQNTYLLSSEVKTRGFIPLSEHLMNATQQSTEGMILFLHRVR